MVSNNLARSLGYGGSKAIRAKSITEGAGCHYKPDHSGDQEGAVNSGRGAKGSGGSINEAPTIRDPLQSKGKR